MNKKTSDKYIIRDILRIFNPYKKKIIVVITYILISSVLNMITPMLNKKIMDEGLILKDINIVLKYSGLYMVVVVANQLIGILETRTRAYLENMVYFNLEKRAFRHLLKINTSFFKDKNYAMVMNNLQTDIGKVSGLCDRNTFSILTGVFRIAAGIVGLSLISWKLSILVLLFIPIRYILVKLFSNLRRNLFKELIHLSQEYSAWQGDTFAGIREVKSWVLESLKTSQFVKLQKQLIKQRIKMSYLEQCNAISEIMFGEIITTIIYIAGGYFIAGNDLTVGELFAFVTYSAYVTGPIFAIMNIKYTLAGILPSAKRYFEFLKIEEEESKEVRHLRIDKEKVKGSIEFKNVDFSYKDNEPVLKNINFKINAGEKIAIIGRNGSGKTTIINLILRFLKPDSGKILLDGRDINDIKLKDYRNLISIVSQEIYLFNTSIKENILLNSNKTDSDLKEVSRECMADEFIEKMELKYDSLVGERGGKLSGGERQKVAMARALIRKSKILILDEATANYDIKSERQINNIIEENYKDETVIIITHRPDVLEKVDKVVIVNNGEIEDIGTHNDLYERNKFYREMVSIPEGMVI